MECDSLNQVVMRNLDVIQGQRIEPQISFDFDGLLAKFSVLCREDSLQNLIHIKDREIQELKESQTAVTVEVEKQLSHWQSFILVLGYINLFIITLTIIVVVVKIVLRYYGLKN